MGFQAGRPLLYHIFADKVYGVLDAVTCIHFYLLFSDI